MSYSTKQKEELLNIIKNRKEYFTVKDIYEETNKSIGLTTIYRFIDSLIKDGSINKLVGNNKIVYYEYLEKCNHNNHFYLKCDNCKKIEHIDCDCIITLWDHIYDTHKFIPNKEHVVINGICNECKKGGLIRC